MKLNAYRVSLPDVKITTAPKTRDVFESSNQRFMLRCLHLVIAAQAGWFICTTEEIKFNCRNTKAPNGIEVSANSLAISHFGENVLTFSIPFIWETEKGWNLLIRGPSNYPVDWGSPLEGIVESGQDLNVTAPMNWVVPKFNEEITLPKGFPYAMVVPVRDDLESFDPIEFPWEKTPEEKRKKYLEWTSSRNNFNAKLKEFNSEESKRGWQKDYMVGSPKVGNFDNHKTKLQLREFKLL